MSVVTVTFTQRGHVSPLFPMGDDDPPTDARGVVWDSDCDGNGADVVSWYQEQPVFSLNLFDRLRIDKSTGD